MYHLFYRDRKTTVKAAVDRSQDRYLSVQSFSSSFWSSAISSAASFLIVITSFGDNKFASPPDPSSHPSIHLSSHLFQVWLAVKSSLSRSLVDFLLSPQSIFLKQMLVHLWLSFSRSHSHWPLVKVRKKR